MVKSHLLTSRRFSSLGSTAPDDSFVRCGHRTAQNKIKLDLGNEILYFILGILSSRGWQPANPCKCSAGSCRWLASDQRWLSAVVFSVLLCPTLGSHISKASRTEQRSDNLPIRRLRWSGS